MEYITGMNLLAAALLIGLGALGTAVSASVCWAASSWTALPVSRNWARMLPGDACSSFAGLLDAVTDDRCRCRLACCCSPTRSSSSCG
jgi:hypothetical protein